MKKIYLSLLFTLSLTYSSYAQWTNGTDISNTNSGSVGIGTTTPVSKLDVNGNGNYTGSLQVGNSKVNSNTTKLFINNNYGDGKNWALSAGANNMTEQGFHIYNWTDYPGLPWFSIDNTGGATIRNIGGGTLTLVKSSTSIPAIIFQGATSSTILEAGDAYFTASVGGSRRLTVLSNGSVGIGTINPNGYMLAVNGSVHAQNITVDTNNWPDFVFEKEYALPSLSTLKTYVDQNHHLPEIPSKQEIEDKGLDLGEMNRLLIKKVEELTLYVIEQHKQIEMLAKKDKLNQVQAQKIKDIEKRINALSKH